MFVNTTTGAAMTAAQIIAAHPLTVFPAPFAPPDGYAPLADIAPPAHDPDTQRLEPLAPVKVGSTWEPRWQVVDLTPAEIAAIAKAKVPASVTMRQGRLALLAAGKLAQVDAAIASLPEPQKSAALIEWNYSNELQRGNAFVATLGAALGLSDAQVDQLFITAAAL